MQLTKKSTKILNNEDDFLEYINDMFNAQQDKKNEPNNYDLEQDKKLTKMSLKNRGSMSKLIMNQILKK